MILVEHKPPPTETSVEYSGGWPQTHAEFEAFITAFQDRLVRYAFRRLGDFHEAEDAVQEVFVKCYRLRGQLGHVTSIMAYLYRMTGNVCTDRGRRKRPHIVPIDCIDAESMPDSQATARERAAAAEELQLASKLLGTLPGRQAEVLKLHVLDELPLRDIAEVQECSVATVKSRLRYGIASLRKHLASRKERML